MLFHSLSFRPDKIGQREPIQIVRDDRIESLPQRDRAARIAVRTWQASFFKTRDGRQRTFHAFKDLFDRVLPGVFGKPVAASFSAQTGNHLFWDSCFTIASRYFSENEGKNIVVLFPDAGDRYLSTHLFEH